MSLEGFKNLFGIISDQSLKYNQERSRIDVSFKDDSSRDRIYEKLLSNNITCSKTHNEVQVNCFQPDYQIFWDINDFRTRILTVDPEDLEDIIKKDCAIFTSEEDIVQTPIFFEMAYQKVFVKFEEIADFFLFSNAFHFIEFLHLLKKQEHQEDGKFHFVDHFSWDTGSIILISSAKEGKLLIPFEFKVPDFASDIDLSKGFNSFKKVFQTENLSEHFPKFIKAEVFNQLAIVDKTDRIKIFFEKLNNILEIAEQNFDVFVSGLSYENIKKQYIASRDKYFAELREISSKVTSQIIGLPISITAVGLATFNIPTSAQGTDLLFYILIAVFFLYAIFQVNMLKLYKLDVDDLKEQYHRDFAELTSNRFFEKNEEEMEHFEHIKTKVSGKLNFMQTGLFMYILLVMVTNCVLVGYLLNKVGQNPVWVVFLFLILLYFYFKDDPFFRGSAFRIKIQNK